MDPTKSSSSSSAANKARKGSLSAVIDKLKTRCVSDDSPPNTPTQPTPPHVQSFDMNVVPVSVPQTVSKVDVERPKEKSSSSSSGGSGSSGSSSSKTGSSSSSSNNSEYMVKHSSDGMKITINKTRTKDSHSPSSKQSYPSGSGSHSPKLHTGLKPGVNSGPASKKPHSSDVPKDERIATFLKRSLNIDPISGSGGGVGGIGGGSGSSSSSSSGSSSSISHLNNQSHG